MTVVTSSSSFGRPQPLRWTGDAFDLASEVGVFDGRRVELIDGELLERAPMNDPHAQAVQIATYTLPIAFPPPKYTIRCQLPMRLGDSRPFPDFAVVMGSPRQIIKHPTTALLVIEISDTTLQFDQTEKATLYATHMLPEYWVVDLNARCVEVYRRPFRSAGIGPKYADVKTYAAQDSISPMSLPATAIQVADLLP